MTCQARQYGDEMQCPRCGLSWDVKDSERPECRTEEELRRERGREALGALHEGLSAKEGADERRFVTFCRKQRYQAMRETERRANLYAELLPAGPERKRAFEVVEQIHDLINSL